MNTILFTIVMIAFLLTMWLHLDFKFGSKRQQQLVEKYEFPLRQSNIEVFISGRELFDDYFEALRSAKHHIHILFYIVKNDKISHDFFTILKQKAAEGVEVRLLVDWVGGLNLAKKELNLLRNSGVQFVYCNKPRFPYFFYTLNTRNHRKISVIDGKLGYVGGFNVGKEYLGHNPKFGNWRDYHLKIDGEGVQDLQQQFLQDWHAATGESFSTQAEFFPILKKGKLKHKFIPTNGGYLKEIILNTIHQAQHEIIIGSPYFIPGKDILESLIAACKRGVHIKILVPMKADHPFVKEAAIPYFKRLMKAGCHIYRFYYGFYHAKIIVIDGAFCDIGTANFDKRSFYLNQEINCFIYDKSFTQKVREQMYSDIEKSEALTLEALQKRSILEKSKDPFSTLISDLL